MENAITIKGNPFTLIGNPVKVGDVAPDAELTANDWSAVKLSDYAGKARLINVVILAGYGHLRCANAQVQRRSDQARQRRGRADDQRRFAVRANTVVRRFGTGKRHNAVRPQDTGVLRRIRRTSQRATSDGTRGVCGGQGRDRVLRRVRAGNCQPSELRCGAPGPQAGRQQVG